ncbi:MAG: carboxypeptidase-like regulatory domain-containing protein [Bacteroidales bacterium]|nr:carboxypeptidase-like regulatory domain-containing protein [Bacteroidales bacterium]
MKCNILFVLFLSLFSIQVSYAQKSNKKIKITGVVVDANRRPVEGAIILVDEVKTDVVTNSKGVYNIKVPPTAKTLTILSLYNNDMKVIEINGNTVVNFILDKASTNTSEQVQKKSETVDIGYGTNRKDQSSNSGSKAEVNTTRAKSYLNIYEMIKSEVPGVKVIGTSIQLQQGSGSLTSSTEPLFVVDGTIVDQINDIVPSQVRSISLLKGSAASIYGARGANGVIVITFIK